MVLGSERIDASINADVANGKLWTLDKVRYLINGSIAEAAYSSCHRPSPSMSLAIFGVAVRSTRGSGPVSRPSRPGCSKRRDHLTRFALAVAAFARPDQRVDIFGPSNPADAAMPESRLPFASAERPATPLRSRRGSCQ